MNILLLNVTGLNSAVKRTCVLEYLHRKSISGALICNTASSGIFLNMFWECPVVMDLWTHVDLGPVSERRLSENSEYVNPEMRETLGFLFQNGRFVKPGKAG